MSGPPSPIRNSADLAQLLATSPTQNDSHVAGLRGKIELIDYDLTDTERESEKLTKKLNKRMSGNRADIQSPSEYFVDKLTRWHSNKKVEKLKSLLALHLPKVKHLEEDALSSVTSVTASKDAAFKSANLVLSLVDKQIDYYQQHMNFLEDVINDIRQCDYTIVREILEMKTAFAFSQELEDNTRSSSRNGIVSNPCSVLLKVGVDSSGHVPSLRVLDDDSVIPGFEYLAKPGAKRPDHHDHEDCTTLPRSLRRELLPPAVARSTAGDCFDPHAPESNYYPARPLPITPRGATSGSSSPVNVNEAHHDEPTSMHHDGTDYKRKCLQSSSINIQSLNLTQASLGLHPEMKKKKCEEELKGVHSPRAFMRAVSERLSDLTHFSKDHRETKSNKELGKPRSSSQSSSPGGSDRFDKAEKPNTIQERRMSMGSFTHAAPSGKEGTRLLRPLSLGSVSHSEGSQSHFTAISPVATSAPLASNFSAPILSHSHTPRPHILTGSLPLKDAHNPHHNPHHHKEHHKDPSHGSSGTFTAAVDTGIAFEEPNLPSPPSSGPPSARPNAHDSVSHASSWGNFSRPSTSNSSQNNLAGLHTHHESAEGSEKKRTKYAALLHHYPHLYPCLLDPAVKLVAKRLNKFLKFKDELARSLIRAEAVQESETNCLRKMRRVQHELQDLTKFSTATVTVTETRAASHSTGTGHDAAHPAVVLTSSLSNNSSGSYSYSSSNNGLDHETSAAHEAQNNMHYNGSNDNNNHNNNTAENSAASALDSEPVSALLARAKLADHDLYSTDEEHEGGSPHAHQDEFGPLLSHSYSSDASAPKHSAIVVANFSDRDNDPTIIDICQDAALVQISVQLLEAASKSVQQLRLLLAEEQDASEQLARARHLLSSATHIKEQIQGHLSPCA